MASCLYYPLSTWPDHARYSQIIMPDKVYSSSWKRWGYGRGHWWNQTRATCLHPILFCIWQIISYVYLLLLQAVLLLWALQSSPEFCWLYLLCWPLYNVKWLPLPPSLSTVHAHSPCSPPWTSLEALPWIVKIEAVFLV